MIKALRFFVASSLLTIPQIVQADFVIYLRNRNEVEVEQYEEIGDHLQYRRFGGQIRLPKADVIAILDRETGDVRLFYEGFTPQQVEAIRKLSEEFRKRIEARRAEEAREDEEYVRKAEEDARKAEEDAIRRHEAARRLREQRERKEREQAEQAWLRKHQDRMAICLLREYEHYIKRLKTEEEWTAYCKTLVVLGYY